MTQTATDGRIHRRLALRLALIVAAMFGFGYALVPLYQVFCEVAGINGKTGRVSEARATSGPVDAKRTVTVEFVATVNDLPWRLRPEVKSISVHPGAVTEVLFYAENLSSQPQAGQAVPSLVPGAASKFFMKTECFCFTKQSLAAGEGRHMPVRFVVDARIPDSIRTLTLSYTFFRVADAVADNGRSS
ncbi:MAG: cytochrome c oxidase assembly protein [Gammaproteobacteria bacterium]